MPFQSEKELFEAAVQSAVFREFRPSHTLVEPKGLFGIPDLVFMTFPEVEPRVPNVISYAFEMKLSNWQRAIVQAFRYKAFATMSFVVMDYTYIGRALRNLKRFEGTNIGLISVERFGNVNMHYMPQPDTPYSPQLELALVKMAANNPVVS